MEDIRRQLGDLTLGHRPLVSEPLAKEDWQQVYDSLRAFQFQLRLIVKRARQRNDQEAP
jgi:hypothetical protein